MAVYLGKNKVSGIGGQGVIGTDTSDANATATDLLSGKTAYVNGEKITGTLQSKDSSNVSASGKTVTVQAGYYPSNVSVSVANVSQATPSISIDNSGLITASSQQSEGYVSSGTKTNTKQLTIKNATTITPGTVNQSIDANTYLIGDQTILGDSNLIASNIKSGISIFGVNGTYSGNGAEAYLMTSLSDKFTFTSSGNLEVWGTATQSSRVGIAGYSKTLAFHGNNYTTSTFTYTGGNQTTENLTLSLNADGTLNGLPSDLTEITILVMKRN